MFRTEVIGRGRVRPDLWVFSLPFSAGSRKPGFVSPVVLIWDRYSRGLSVESRRPRSGGRGQGGTGSDPSWGRETGRSRSGRRTPCLYLVLGDVVDGHLRNLVASSEVSYRGRSDRE